MNPAVAIPLLFSSSGSSGQSEPPEGADAQTMADNGMSFVSTIAVSAIAIAAIIVSLNFFFKAFRSMVLENDPTRVIANIMKGVIASVVGILVLAGVMELFNIGSPSKEEGGAPKQEPDAAADAVNSTDSNVGVIALIVVAVTVITIAIFIVVKRELKARKILKAQQHELRAAIKYADEIVSKVSAEYAQAHVDPNYVLYKPLVISKSRIALNFVDELMDAQKQVSQNKEWFGSDESPLSVLSSEERADKIKALADDLQKSWTNLNREAERVGTPILDDKTLRRVEALWSLASNESATAAEREHAMSKLEDILKDCKRELSSFKFFKKHETREKEESLDAIRDTLQNHKSRGIIAPPASLELGSIKPSLALEAPQAN